MYKDTVNTHINKKSGSLPINTATSLRLSKKPRKVWAFSQLCDIMFLGDENVAKEQTTKDTNRDDMKQIQMILGHSDYATTANIYSHLDYADKVSATKEMKNILYGNE